MIATKTEFPNPVLADGRDDYIEACYFRTFLNVEDIDVDNRNIIIPIRYEMKCDGLQKLIDSGEAVAIISVKSSAASYSRIFTFPADKTGMTIEIPKYDVVTKIDVTCSVIAAQDIKNFTCPGEFNELYFGGIAF
ncbi:MAG: hypothetical protein K6G55_00145 [Selenomonadaceae bacterium]|nr:hypothetical protein [Selenomonadaceae bacterium]